LPFWKICYDKTEGETLQMIPIKRLAFVAYGQVVPDPHDPPVSLSWAVV
jgi:hypothetical protein